MPPESFQNLILTALPESEIAQIREVLRPTKLVAGRVLYQVGAPTTDLYFLENTFVSFVADTGDGCSVEIGSTGNDGVIGIIGLLTPGAHTVHRSVVQISGMGYRIPISAFQSANLPTLNAICIRYIEFLLVQAGQSGACSVRHEIPERLARWVLTACDRIGIDEVAVHQDIIAQNLGVRRAGVSVAGKDLQAAGLINQSRGKIAIINREGLELRACSCYRRLQYHQNIVMQQDRAKNNK